MFPGGEVGGDLQVLEVPAEAVEPRESLLLPTHAAVDVQAGKALRQWRLILPPTDSVAAASEGLRVRIPLLANAPVLRVGLEDPLGGQEDPGLTGCLLRRCTTATWR